MEPLDDKVGGDSDGDGKPDWVLIGANSAYVEDMEVTDTLPPLDIDPSHQLVVCGGYAGCISCGGVAGFERTTKLVQLCKRSCPPGSRGPIRNLCKGSLPRLKVVNGVTTGQVWPSGESDPVVRRYVAAASSSSHPRVGVG